MKRYYVIISGRVQGVGFRWTIKELARINNFTGWVRNLSNGNVEMEIQGENIDINSLLHQLENKSYWIKISDYSQKEVPQVLLETSFIIK